jgi:CRISPR-associated protein Csm3
MRLIKYKKITGKILVKTGLHIGGSVDVIEIQGVDNPIIKNPITNEPYIPGSSLKGKMRSLLEWKLGKIDRDGEPHKWCGNIKCPICRIFGTSSDDANLGPTRVLVRDAELTSEYKDEIHKEGKTLTEVKYENSINRISAKANPRPLERVSAGVEFDFEILYRVFDMGDKGKTDEDMFKHVVDGLRYLQQDALGGSGSRGSGKIAFKELKDEGGEDINLFDLEEVQDESL